MVQVKDIQLAVAGAFEVPVNEMVSDRRAGARARQIAMYLARELTPHSLPAIGRLFGGRDYSTVMHAIRRVEALSRSDAEFAERIAALKQHLSGEGHDERANRSAYFREKRSQT